MKTLYYDLYAVTGFDKDGKPIKGKKLKSKVLLGENQVEALNAHVKTTLQYWVVSRTAKETKETKKED